MGHQTFVEEYKENELTVLCLDRKSGWDAECQVHNNDTLLMPTRRLIHDRLFATWEDARAAGMEFCRQFVDRNTSG